MLAVLVVATVVAEEADTGNQECTVSSDSGGAGLVGVPECPCLLVPEDFDGEMWEYRSASGYRAAGIYLHTLHVKKQHRADHFCPANFRFFPCLALVAS